MTNTETKDADGKQQPTDTMVKESTVKDDGRFLFYYSFPEKTDASNGTVKQEGENV